MRFEVQKGAFAIEVQNGHLLLKCKRGICYAVSAKGAFTIAVQRGHIDIAAQRGIFGINNQRQDYWY